MPFLNFSRKALLPPTFLQTKPPAFKHDKPAFVARKRELDQLEDHLAKTLAGDGHVVFILGEAGRGKTRLLREFSQRSQAAHPDLPDLVAVEGRCNDREGSGAPYLPFRDVLNMLTGDLESGWETGNLSQTHVLRLWDLLPLTIRSITEFGPDLVGTLIPGIPLVRRLLPYIGKQSGWLDDFQALVDQGKDQAEKVEKGHLLEKVSQVLRRIAVQRPLIISLTSERPISLKCSRPA